MLLRKVEDEEAIGSVSNGIVNEVAECTKMLRRALLGLSSSTNLVNNRCSALIIDYIWRITVLNMDALLEHESRFTAKATKELKKNALLLEERYKKRLDRLESREQELQLEFTMHKEKYEAQIAALAKDKERINGILDARMMEMQDLLDPSRFMQVHYFLSEFGYKFESSYERNLSRLHLTNNVLRILAAKSNASKELNDELSTPATYFPKYIIDILRNLQKQLKISDNEMLHRMKRNRETMENIRCGKLVVRKLEDSYSQTDLSKESKMTLYNDKLRWKAVVLGENIMKAKAIPLAEAHGMLEKTVRDKLVYDNFSSLWCKHSEHLCLQNLW